MLRSRLKYHHAPTHGGRSTAYTASLISHVSILLLLIVRVSTLIFFVHQSFVPKCSTCNANRLHCPTPNFHVHNVPVAKVEGATLHFTSIAEVAQQRSNV